MPASHPEVSWPLTDEERLLQATAREFAERELAPGAAERDEAEHFDRGLFARMGAGEVAAPDFTLRDQTGATVSMSQLRGTVLALTFLDTQCQNLCPLQASFLGSAQSDLGHRAPFDVVIISVRPDADTPANIVAFAAAHGLGHHYMWLTGTTQDLQGVWNSYGVAVQAAQGDLAHSSVIYLIDRSGYERVGFEDVPETAAFETDVQILNVG